MTQTNELIKERFMEAANVLNKFMQNEQNLLFVKTLVDSLTKTIMRGNKIISFGNGGSMCDAMHFAEELTGRFRSNRIPLPAVAISDPAHISCVANDFGFDFIFSRFLEGIGKEGDMAIGLTTSGNSTNVNHAFTSASKMGIQTFALCGKDGGKSAIIADHSIIVPSDKSERIQEIHIKILHIAIDLMEVSLKQQNLIK